LFCHCHFWIGRYSAGFSTIDDAQNYDTTFEGDDCASPESVNGRIVAIERKAARTFVWAWASWLSRPAECTEKTLLDRHGLTKSSETGVFTRDGFVVPLPCVTNGLSL
jgi:hypothetical protein